MRVRRWWTGNKATICSCKLKVEQDLGREINLLVLPHLKILTHQAMKKNMGVERKKNNLRTAESGHVLKKYTGEKKSEALKCLDCKEHSGRKEGGFVKINK